MQWKFSKNSYQKKKIKMDKTLIVPKQIVTANSSDEILKDYAVEIEGNIITNIIKVTDKFVDEYDGIVLYSPSYTLIPGFIQTHVHLCQTLFRGLADDLELLDWLQLKIFPFEKAHDKDSLKISSKLGIYELQTSGTTTILDMGTIKNQEIIFEEIIHSGMRAIAGKCMMDCNNLLSDFKESTEDAIKTSYELAKEFHKNQNDRVSYGFAPRFVLSCSEKLLKESAMMATEFEGSIFHTHASENKSEIEEVRKKYCMDNIEYFSSISVLNEKTILAHCVHITDNEINILKKSDARVAHCPSSNLKLGSGIAGIPKFIREGIKVSLGADGASCNNNLSMFSEMKLAALIQKPIYNSKTMDAKTVFRLATIDGARVLNMGNEIGSVEIGKKADLVLIDLDTPLASMSEEENSVYSDLVYSCSRGNVKDVMIDGEWVVKNGESLNYLPEDLCIDGKNELENLLTRV
jgi:5-methylthioadenosine/S-adenosylhomocysteine deaminase